MSAFDEPDPTPGPPRPAVWLARLATPARDREFALGDLDEEFREEMTARGVRSARRWYWRQAWRCVRTRARPALPAPPRRPLMATGQDIRFAFRLLRRSPGFTTAAVITLALGIGATCAIYAVVHAVILAPLPFAQADRLTLVRLGPSPAEATSISYPAFVEWRDAGLFDVVEAAFPASTTLTGAGADPEQVFGLRTSGGLLSTLGVAPVAGALFTRADEPRTAPAKVLIGEGLWRRRFAASPLAVGQSISLGGVPFTIVGVLPSTFRLRPSDDPPDVVMPLRLNETVAPASLNFITAIGRLKPGQTPAQAKAQLEALMRGLRPDAQPAPTATVIPVRDVIVGDTRDMLFVLLAAVGCLLLITCANLANLLLARAMGRREEIAVRVALGAGRLRIGRQLLTESLVLALAGGALGALLAWLGVEGAGDLAIVRQAGAYEVALSLPVLTFAFGISTAAGVLFGLAPAIAGGRQPLRTSLGHAERVSAAHPLRTALIVVEVALTLVLLVGSGLFMRSFINLLSVDRGFATEGVIAFDLSTPGAQYPTPELRTQFFRTVIERLSALPGVTGAGFVNERPLGGGGVNGGIPIEGMTFPPGQGAQAEKRIVSPDYFKTLGIGVVEGRTFTDRDSAGNEPVTVVSESFARRYFPDAPALGRRIGFNWDLQGTQTIVGVVADIKHYGLDDPPLPTVYVSYLQRPLDAAGVVVKTTGDAAALVPAIRDTIRGIDRDRPLVSLETLDDSVAASVALRRFLLWLAAGFAGLALVLAATGIFGVVSYAARARTREFGIRIALGAESGTIVRLAAAHGIVPVAAGLVLGAGASLLATRALHAQLYGVAPADPLTFAVVIVGLGTVGAAACLLPALRTVRLNPVAALRRE